MRTLLKLGRYAKKHVNPESVTYKEDLKQEMNIAIKSWQRDPAFRFMIKVQPLKPIVKC